MSFARILLLTAFSLTGVSAKGGAIQEERIEHAGAVFRVVKLPPKRVDLVWKDESGAPYRRFGVVHAAMAERGKTLRFLMNAGIFEPGGIPSGLHIENGKELRPLNLADAPGNFFLKPNGVIILHHDAKVTLTTSEDWQRNPHGSPVWGIQAGPMLLIKGRRHPAFREESVNLLRRNGMGIDENGMLVFAITDRHQEVNLWNFAGLFLKLGCKDALFLDGDISAMAVNPEGPVKSNQFGAIFVVAD